MQLSVREASEILKVSEKTIYRWIKRGVLRAARVNDQYRLHRSDLLEWTTSRKMDAPVEVFADSNQNGASANVLVDALRAGGIFYGLVGDDKPSVLRAVIETLKLLANEDRKFLFRILAAREALGSTGVGDGIAIPHVRRPIVLKALRPAISLCFLANPIDFGAFDAKPVYALFVLISPTVRLHLHLLSRLSFALNDSGLKQAIERRASPDEILAEFRRVESVPRELHSPTPGGKG